MPRRGRVRFLASKFSSSIFGFPVFGSFGSLSHTSVPHSASPQLLIRIWLSLPSVYQVPNGSAADAGAIAFGPIIDNAIVESQNAAAALRLMLIGFLVPLVCEIGKDGRGHTLIGYKNDLCG